MKGGKRYGSIPVVNIDDCDDEARKILAARADSIRRGCQRSPVLLLALLTFVGIVLLSTFGELRESESREASLEVLGSSQSGQHDVHGIHLGEALTKTKMDGKPLFFRQITDHLDPNCNQTFPHRFYKVTKHFRGPGHPIFVILGGEDELDGLLYPFVYERLAKSFGAFVVEPEHRFYGVSQPVHDPSVQDLTTLLTPDQALLDAVSLIQYTRQQLGCSMDRTSPLYCPVISVGGSYPGFLSAMLRFVYPDIVDISYASSAPLFLYSQEAAPYDYYDKVSQVAEQAVPGCVNSVRSVLLEAQEQLLTNKDHWSLKHAAHKIGFCPDRLPSYMKKIETLVSEGIVFLVPAIFADFNMAYYPPGPDTALERACAIFQSPNHDALSKIGRFMELRGEVEYGGDKPTCFDMRLELPAGPHSRIMGSDWSGSGGGFTGMIWEFQCCKDLVIRTGYSADSMFIPREWTYEWHQQHCQERFPGVPIGPTRMVDQWGFDDLRNASRILFVNGLNDGWSASSHVQDVVPGSVVAVNLPNGAHHSDLSHIFPNKEDTNDVVKGYDTIEAVLLQWLEEINQEEGA